MMPETVVLEDPAALAEAAAQRFVDVARSAIEQYGQFCVALSGGSTPRVLYQRLAGQPYRDQIDWERVQVFFSDERFVPPESLESNFHLASEALLSRVPLPERWVHLVPTVEVEPEEAAANYEEAIRRLVRTPAGGIPVFDLILLGLGPDGHTASLFPDTPALRENERLVAANYVPQANTWRITFTYPLINAGAVVMFLAQGEEKAERVAQAFRGDEAIPAARVRPEPGKLVWMIDRAAASRLPPETQQRTTAS